MNHQKGTIEAKNLKVVLRALGFDPSNDEIIMLIRELGKNITKLEEYRIDFQEFLEIMIAKMVCRHLIRMKKTQILI
jgi:centrin-1